MKERHHTVDDSEIMVGQKTGRKADKIDYYVYFRKIVRNAVLSFFLGIMVHGFFIGR